MQNKLRNICAKNNMTLQELGARLGKSKQYMSELGRGNIRLTYDMAVKIARVFNTTPDTLFLTDKSNKMGLTTNAAGRA
jgi:putative transcriptional regulator